MLVNVRGTKFWGISRAESVEEFSFTEFHAQRAFPVEEFEDEGSSYFIDLMNGSVLFLSGHYFRELEPLEYDGRLVQKREFPCTDFIIRRREDGTAVDIQCRGRVLELDVVTPPFLEGDFRNGTIPKDGEILSQNYDELKTARLKQLELGSPR